jgi:hypothetical protein
MMAETMIAVGLALIALAAWVRAGQAKALAQEIADDAADSSEQLADELHARMRGLEAALVAAQPKRRTRKAKAQAETPEARS